MTDDASRDIALSDLERMLLRAEPINTIDCLLSATQTASSGAPLLTRAAVCLDTNIFFRLANDSERANVIDYLASQHKNALIVSAQSIQEIWNNYFNGIDTIAVELRKKFEAIESIIAPLESGFHDYRSRFYDVLSDFKDEFGHLHNEGMKDRLRSLIEILQRRAKFIEVPRLRFQQFYSARKITKTPPAFKDDGAGDYYIWLDFLYGLRAARTAGDDFERAVLVTSDRKIDWVRGSVAHPTLAAECLSYVGVPLEIWTLKQLIEATKGS